MTGSENGSFESLSLTLQRLVVGVCDRFEAAWRQGERPAIEQYLEGLSPAERVAALRELVALEVELRHEFGEPCALEALLARFPERAVVEAGFRMALDPQSRRARDLVTRTQSGPADGNQGTRGAADDRETEEWDSARDSEANEILPRPLGRYKLLKRLGQGGFGVVYLARDDTLDREVAIKVPRTLAPSSRDRFSALLGEAQSAARLRHPAIVAVHDISHDDDGTPFLVLEYVPGRTLGRLLERRRPELTRLVKLLARVAEAVHYAHTEGMVHRDLKPSNILIDRAGEPRVTDFGLAVSEVVLRDRAGEIAGTPAYMAPEQIRGETHRLDGRTDVWALGVILYQCLARRLPFAAEPREALFEEILNREPRPPRQIDDTLPRELERICLKCLAKRMTDRYQTAADLAEDLRHWLAMVSPALTPTSAPAAMSSALAAPTLADSSLPLVACPRAVPKGLRAFGDEDASYFWNLLPGPRDRDGLPEPVRFWKTRIERIDSSRTFSVGLLYGPSGCGKSSLVQAGLVPWLRSHVQTITLAAAPRGTEDRLRAALKQRFPGLPPTEDLAGIFEVIREGAMLPKSAKLLVVLDQFEQWLHGNRPEPTAELVRALRQCDGGRVQALVLVRDDFWMAITRFFQALENRLVEGHNAAMVELFDAAHARRVLIEFGRAYGRVPEGEVEPRDGLGQFLDRSIAELAGPDGRINPVRLVLFLEMMRNRPWTPAALRDLGGFEGIGATFLEASFGPTAPPTHRLHARAAQAVLAALLPESASDLRETVRTEEHLRAAAGYTGRPEDFDDLMHVLDDELRLVTPVDPEGVGSGGGAGVVSFQLTHDYLVPSLRQWLTRKQRETRRGRAELRLAELTALWRDRPGSRLLPTGAEWLGLLWHTRGRPWSADERRMMRAATGYYLRRLGGTLVAVLLLLWAGTTLYQRSHAAALLGVALSVDEERLPAWLPEIARHFSGLRDGLERVEGDPTAPARDRARAAALLFRHRATPARAELLQERLLVAEPNELEILADALSTAPPPQTRLALQERVLDARVAPQVRLRALCGLARLDPDGDGWIAAAPVLARALLSQDRRAIPHWIKLLGPQAERLVPALSRYHRDPNPDPAVPAAAAEALAEILGHRQHGAGLAAALLDAGAATFRVLFQELRQLSDTTAAREVLERSLVVTAAPEDDEAQKDQRAHQQANAAAALLGLGRPEPLWPRLQHAEDPRLRALLIQRLAVLELDDRALVERLAHESNAAGLQALLLVWAERDPDRILPQHQTRLVETAGTLYREHPDPGVHSAAGLLLRRWGRADQAAREDAAAAQRDAETWSVPIARGERGWFSGPNGHTFAILPAPREFWMGSPGTELGRFGNERLHYRRLTRALAVATQEVSYEQFIRFDPGHKQDSRFGTAPELPANRVTWYRAAAYCNWLSAEAGIPPEQWCYRGPIGPGMVLDAGAVERTGYRLPTEAEWEDLSRAGTRTSRYFGESSELLSRYAWTWLNSDERILPVAQLLPNEWGLFDTLGNVWEWCHDGAPIGGERDSLSAYPSGTPADPAEDHLPEEILEPTPEQADARAGRIASRARNARGGGFDFAPSKARSANRYLVSVKIDHAYMGFRVVRTLRDPVASGNGL